MKYEAFDIADVRSFLAGGWRWSMILLLACTICVPMVSGQSIRAYVSEDSVRVGDRFSLTIVAEHGFPDAPLFPGPEAGEEFFGDLEVLEITARGTSPIEEGRTRVDSLLYQVTTFALDTAFVPSIPVFFVAGTDTSFFASYPIEIPVISLVSADAEDIRDLAPLAEFPINPWPWILGFLLLGAAIAGGYYYWKRRGPPEREIVLEAPAPKIPPYEEAIGRLRALEKSSNLQDELQVKPYFVELTEILRVYFGRRLGIHAMETTSYELMKDLNQLALAKKITPEAVYLTKRVLHVADLVKFADMHPPPEVGHQALLESRKVLENIEEGLRPAVPEPPPDESAESPSEMEATVENGEE